jgi:hypothetical protein
MSKLYRRNCDNFGKYYEGRGKNFCSHDCKNKYLGSIKKQDVRKRFWSKVDIKDLFDCWEWQASKDNDGYGNFRVEGKTKQSHRFAWELVYGKIPEGLLCLHICNNPSCVNLSHLYLGTDQNNMDDKVKANRQSKLKGEQCGRSKLTNNDVVQILVLIKQGYKNKDISKIFKVTPDNVGYIRRRQTWKNIKH